MMGPEVSSSQRSGRTGRKDTPKTVGRRAGENYQEHLAWTRALVV